MRQKLYRAQKEASNEKKQFASQITRLQTENNVLQNLIDDYFKDKTINTSTIKESKDQIDSKVTLNINETTTNWSLFNLFRG